MLYLPWLANSCWSCWSSKDSWSPTFSSPSEHDQHDNIQHFRNIHAKQTILWLGAAPTHGPKPSATGRERGAAMVDPIKLGRPKRKIGGGERSKARGWAGGLARRKRPAGRNEEEEREKRRKHFSFSNQISNSISKWFLIPFKFKSKPLNILNTMLQHECINMYISLWWILISQKILFSYIWMHT